MTQESYMEMYIRGKAMREEIKGLNLNIIFNFGGFYKKKSIPKKRKKRLHYNPVICNCSICSKCRECNQNYQKGSCDMCCSIKGKEKIYPTDFSIANIKTTLENNVGCFISKPDIRNYTREISQILILASLS